MKSTRRSGKGPPGRRVPQVIVAFAFFIPLPSSSAYDAAPAAQETVEPAVPSKAEPVAGAEPVAKATPAPSADYKATKKIPRKLLRPLLGCWQLDEQERWTLSRLDVSGAQVVTTLMKGAKKRPGRPSFPDYVRRAAVPATLMYDAQQDNFGFATAARIHTSLVVFRQSGAILEAGLYSRRSRKDRYAFTGHSATLERCKAPARGHSSRPRPAVVPPRLK